MNGQQLSADDLCKIECAIHEAIGLNNDQHLTSDDPAEKRALLANAEQYRRVLVRVRLARDAIATQNEGMVAPEPKPTLYDQYRLLVALAVHASRRINYQGAQNVFAPVVAECEAAWRRLVTDGYAKEVGRSMFALVEPKP